jgi:hypothetical protein
MQAASLKIWVGWGSLSTETREGGEEAIVKAVKEQGREGAGRPSRSWPGWRAPWPPGSRQVAARKETLGR